MLTRGADYATRVMIHLAGLPAGSRVQLAKLAEATDVPQSFMSKVLQGLVRARLILSQPGVNGGFELARPAVEITMLDVLESIDGPLQLNTCVASPDRCDRDPWCAAHLVWVEAQQAMIGVLKSATIAKLAERSAALRSALAGKKRFLVSVPDSGHHSPAARRKDRRV